MDEPSYFTPFPVGEMPATVERWDDGPPFGRLALRLSPEDQALIGDGRLGDHTFIVCDLTSGERFKIEAADCGLGCRCAAEARWIPADENNITKKAEGR